MGRVARGLCNKLSELGINAPERFFVRPKKHLGQNFLRKQSLADQIADQLLECKDNTLIFEIGCGTGKLTEALLKKPGKIVGIEYDDEFMPILNRLSESSNGKFVIARGDILNSYHSESIARAEDLYQTNGDMRIVGNLPFNISTKLLRSLIYDMGTKKGFFSKDINVEMLITVQEEVANKITAMRHSKNRNNLAVLTQVMFHTVKTLSIDRCSFSPAPKVNGAVLRLTRRKEPLLNCPIKDFDFVTRFLFNTKKRCISSIIKNEIRKKKLGVINTEVCGLESANLMETLAGFGIKEDDRAIDASLKSLCDLSKYFSSHNALNYPKLGYQP